MTGPEPGGPGTAERRSATGPAQQEVDLVGPDLRVRGRISLGRFSTLADLVNHNRSFLALHEARLLDRAGEPTGLELAELVVNQDDVTFVGHQHAAADRVEETSPDTGPDLDRSDGGRDRPGPDSHARRFVIFTPGHAITGGMHLFREMTLANFVEATDPRFIPVSDAVARSLADPEAVSRFELLLVNRTQIGAIAEVDHDSDLIGAAIRASAHRTTPIQRDSAPADPRVRAEGEGR